MLSTSYSIMVINRHLCRNKLYAHDHLIPSNSDAYHFAVVVTFFWFCLIRPHCYISLAFFYCTTFHQPLIFFLSFGHTYIVQMLEPWYKTTLHTHTFKNFILISSATLLMVREGLYFNIFFWLLPMLTSQLCLFYCDHHQLFYFNCNWNIVLVTEHNIDIKYLFLFIDSQTYNNMKMWKQLK